MNRISRCDWLRGRTRWSYLARSEYGLCPAGRIYHSISADIGIVVYPHSRAVVLTVNKLSCIDYFVSKSGVYVIHIKYVLVIGVLKL